MSQDSLLSCEPLDEADSAMPAWSSMLGQGERARGQGSQSSLGLESDRAWTGTLRRLARAQPQVGAEGRVSQAGESPGNGLGTNKPCS